MIKCFIFFTLLSLNIYSAEKLVSLRSDPWCPFACDSQNKQNLGIVVDIAKIVFEKHGLKIDYKNINFGKAIEETRMGKIDGVVGCAQEDAPDFIFPERLIIGTVYQYFTRVDNNFHINLLADLKSEKVGAIKSYTYDEISTKAINEKNDHFVIVSGDEGLKKLIKMLDSKKIDAIIESKEVFNSYLKENKINPKKYRLGGEIRQKPQEINICFSPKNPKSKLYSKWILEGMIELQKNKQYEKILKKYLN